MCLDQFGKFPKDTRVSSNIYGMLVLHREQLFYQNLHRYTFIKSPQNVAPLCSNMKKNGFVLKSLFIQLNKYNYNIRRNHQFAVYEYHTKCAASGKPLMHFLRKKPPWQTGSPSKILSDDIFYRSIFYLAKKKSSCRQVRKMFLNISTTKDEL